jgi:hypothetical protein
VSHSAKEQEGREEGRFDEADRREKDLGEGCDDGIEEESSWGKRAKITTVHDHLGRG